MNKIPIINQIIKDKRKGLKLNQLDFAKLINKSKITVARYDTGDIIPQNTLILICDKLNLDIYDLLKLQENENKENKTIYYKDVILKKSDIMLKKYIDIAFIKIYTDKLEKIFNFSINEENFFKCEFKEEKFYIKDTEYGETFLILTKVQTKKIINDMSNYLDYLLYDITKVETSSKIENFKNKILDKKINNITYFPCPENE